MATVLGLAARISADGSQFQNGLTPVERALRQLDAETAKVTDVFKTFTTATDGAAAAQQRFSTDLGFLTSALKTGKINADEFAAEFAKITAEATATAEAFREGERLTNENRTAEELRAAQLDRLNELLKLGAIDQATFNAEVAKATGAAQAAEEAAKRLADAEKLRSDAAARAAAIVEANLTREQRAQRDFDVATRELNALRNDGLLTESEYATALDRVAREYAKATLAADKYAETAGKSGDAGTGKFRELSSVLSSLPGPIGGIGARLSGLAGTADGVSKIVGGGLSSGLSSAGSALAALANPVGIAVAGIVAVGASAAATFAALGSLTGRVEELSFAARQAGVDFQTIQVLEEAATRAGTSVEAVATGMQKFGRALSEAARGTGDAYKGLTELGFSLEEIQKGQNDPTEFAGRVAKALEGVAAPADRARLQLDILGKGGESLVRAFGELEGATAGVRRFGGAISDLDKDRLLELDGAFENLQRSVLGFGRELLTPFIGEIQSMAEGFAPVIAALGRSLGNLLDTFSPLLSLTGLFTNAASQAASAVLNLTATALEPFAAAGRLAADAINDASKYVTEFWTGVNDSIDTVRNYFGFIFGGIEDTAKKTAVAIVATEEETAAAAAANKKAQEDLAKAVEGGGKALDDIIKKSAAFGQAGTEAALKFQNALVALQRQADANKLNAEQYSRGVALATAEYERQIEVIKRVQEASKKAADERDRETQRQIETNRRRLEALLGPSDKSSKLQDDIRFAIEQQALATQKLTAARLSNDRAAADSAARQLAQIDQLTAKLKEQENAVRKGFTEGYTEAFTKTGEAVKDLTAKASEFGAAGAQAAAELNRRIERLQELTRDGIFTQAAYDAEVARDVKLFEERLARIEKLRKREEEALAATAAARTTAAERVDQYLNAQLGERATAEIQLTEEVARRRQQAAFYVDAIEKRIAAEKKVLEDARDQNNRAAAAAAAERLKELERVLLVEQKIADGRIKQVEAQQTLTAQQERFQQASGDAADKQLQAQQQYAQQQAKIFEQQQAAAAAEADRQRQRIEGLNTLGQQSIAATDVRTREGAALVIDLATQAQDPAMIQARLQTKLLERIALGIGEAASNYFNKPVAIVGYSSFQG